MYLFRAGFISRSSHSDQQKGLKPWHITALFFVSGFCFLSIETIWIRSIGLAIGSTVVSASLVIAVFFLFAALGNLFAGRILPKCRTSLKPYGTFELLCGVSSLLLYLLLPTFRKTFLTHHDVSLWISIHEAVVVGLLVGVPSFFAGATFPSLTHHVVHGNHDRIQKGGIPYASNLLGAALGVIFGGVMAPQWVGYDGIFYVSTLGLVLIGLIAIYLSPVGMKFKHSTPKNKHTTAWTLDMISGYGVLFFSGVLSICLEILILIYFKQLTGISHYSVSAVLFSFILGLSGGSFLATYMRKKGHACKDLVLTFLMLAGIFCMTYPWVLHYFHQHPVLFSNKDTFWKIATIMFFSTGLLFPLLLLVGAIFPLTWELLKKNNPVHGQVIAYMSFINKMGCVVGALLGPFLMMRAFGLPGSFIIVGLLYFLLGVLWLSRGKILAGLLVTLLACGLYAYKPIPVRMNPGETLLDLYQGPDGIVAVYEDQKKSRHILFNQHFVLNGTARALQWQRQESWIPLLLHPDPQHVSFIGMASGISAAAALDFQIKSLESIELSSDVVRAARTHFSSWNQKLFSDPRSHVVTHDGRRVMESSKQPKDVIIMTLLQPNQEGVANLYSKDFFTNIQANLKTDGIFCAWIPLYQHDQETLGIILRTFAQVFPHAFLMHNNLDPTHPTLGIIGAKRPIPFSKKYLTHRLQQYPFLRKESHLIKSADTLQTLIIGDLAANKEQFSSYAITTDNKPELAYVGPKHKAEGTHLRGMTLLHWIDTKFISQDMRSLDLQSDQKNSIENHIQAGKLIYASKIYSVKIPDISYEEDMRRQNQSMQWLAQSLALVPNHQIY